MTPVSCPLYTVRTVDLNGTSTSSVTGSASMSARSATVGPGLAPFRMPTTPGMPPTFSCTSSPNDLRCAATNAAVRFSA